MKKIISFQSILEPRQFISSKMPYADKRFDLKEYNPPSNELGFLGGLGKRTGTTRSKAYVQRPTMNQMLFHMRTANRILVSFSEDPIAAHSLTRKQLEGTPKPIRKATKQDLDLTISKIQIADNVIKVAKGFRGNSTTSETEAVKLEVKVVEPVLVEKRKQRGFSITTMKKISIVSALKSNEPKEEEPQSFRAWALAERDKRHKCLQQVSYQQIKQEREANEIFPRSKKPLRTFLGDNSKNINPELLQGAEHLAGYLYGGFSKDFGPDTTMDNQTKFNVPLTMFSRAQVESKVRAMSRKKIQTARLEYMRIPQIPSDSENSDDIFEDIKGLSLIRTPYFSIPTLKHLKVKRMERLRSKHLKGNRLKRINMLLFDRKFSAAKHKQQFADESFERKVEREESLDDLKVETSISSLTLPPIDDNSSGNN